MREKEDLKELFRKILNETIIGGGQGGGGDIGEDRRGVP